MNTHLDCLLLRLSHERARLTAAKSAGDRELRACWVSGIEKEIAAEYVFLGIAQPLTLDEILMSDDELLRELAA